MQMNRKPFQMKKKKQSTWWLYPQNELISDAKANFGMQMREVLWWSGEPSWCQDHSSTCWCPKNMFGDGVCAKFISSNDMHGFKWAVGHCCRHSQKVCTFDISLKSRWKSIWHHRIAHITGKMSVFHLYLMLKSNRIHLWVNALESMHYDSLSSNLILKKT